MNRCLILILLAACTEHGKGGGVPPNPDGGGSGAQCGGFGGELCPAGEFCDFGSNSCGGSDETGSCRARPVSCPDFFDPVCGCDGQIHGNECDANSVGVDLSDSGGCPLDAGQFACGPRACQRNLEFCQRQGSDIGGEPDTFGCLPMPQSCSSASCSCVSGEPCGANCADDGNGAVTVTCFGG
jgi:hypothetical protein